MKFKVGDKVRWKYGRDYYGTIAGIYNDRDILVFWDGQTKDEDADLYEERELEFPLEGNDIMKALVNE